MTLFTLMSYSDVKQRGLTIAAATQFRDQRSLTSDEISLSQQWVARCMPVSVMISGVSAEVLYAGVAPSLVAGVMQLNARTDLRPGIRRW